MVNAMALKHCAARLKAPVRGTFRIVRHALRTTLRSSALLILSLFGLAVGEVRRMLEAQLMHWR